MTQKHAKQKAKVKYVIYCYYFPNHQVYIGQTKMGIKERERVRWVTNNKAGENARLLELMENYDYEIEELATTTSKHNADIIEDEWIDHFLHKKNRGTRKLIINHFYSNRKKIDKSGYAEYEDEIKASKKSKYRKHKWKKYDRDPRDYGTYTCSACGTPKLYTEYHADRSRFNGLSSRCTFCNYFHTRFIAFCKYKGLSSSQAYWKSKYILKHSTNLDIFYERLMQRNRELRMPYKIYKITFADNSVYIGQTKRKIANRIRQHKASGKNPDLASRFASGMDYKVETLQRLIHEHKNIDEVENYWISKYKMMGREQGFELLNKIWADNSPIHLGNPQYRNSKWKLKKQNQIIYPPAEKGFRICSLCSKKKSLATFIIDKYKKTGRGSRCKDCNNYLCWSRYQATRKGKDGNVAYYQAKREVKNGKPYKQAYLKAIKKHQKQWKYKK